MKKLKIKDIFVVALLKDGRNPIGEACYNDQAYSEMTSDDRVKMMDRLFYKINILMEEAKKTHLASYKKLDANDVDPNFITRLSTNEFFFYTSSPLTLKEFEYLMNKIAEKEEGLSFGIQLVLGSFAVKTADNRVMNITPHITLGRALSFNFIIKNYTSAIDVRFKKKNLYSYIKTLKVFDKYNRTGPEIPKIYIKGTSHSFTFNNVISSKTPGGESFLTAVDICLDHFYGVAKNNVMECLNKKPTLLKQVISHMVLSNCVTLQSRNCFDSVVHVDPEFSSKSYKKYSTQTIRKTDDMPICLGKDNIEIFHLDHIVCQTVEEARELDLLEKLSFGVQDKLMNAFIAKKKYALSVTNTNEERHQILSEIKKITRALEEDEVVKEIRTIIINFRRNAEFFTIGMNRKADRIESALKKVSIEDRCNLLQSDSFKKEIVDALASHRHIGKLTKIYTGETSRTYKNFKMKFFNEETTGQHISEKTELDSSFKKI